MIKEYAVEPALINNWKDARYILEKFGFSNGRVISRFPRQWEGMVKEACKMLLPREKARIIELLVRTRRSLVSFGRSYDRNRDWIANALMTHKKQPYHAIISNMCGKKDDAILSVDEMTEDHQLMQCKRSVQIRRSPKVLAQTLAPVLEIAKRVVFVDPHLSKMKEASFRPLAEFIRILRDRKTSIPLTSIEFHSTTLNDKAAQTLKDKLKDNIGSILPSGIQFNVTFWDPKELHDRYLLTDKGGVKIGAGFDDDAGGKYTNHTTVVLLDDGAYPELWNHYAESGKEPDLTIDGVAT